MPVILQRKYYNGAEQKISRLGLLPLIQEVEKVVTGFDLLLEERRDANGGAYVRQLLDDRFGAQGAWQQRVTGGVDWTKCRTINGTLLCVGVEIQFSGRSDLLIVDVAHLRDQVQGGKIDIGILAVPSDRLGPFLTDRGPRYADAVKAVERARADDLPLAIFGLSHDGAGPPLPKRRTRQGRGP